MATGEPLQCAGGFALEGRGGMVVEKLEGCYSNVIGLSLPLLRCWLSGVRDGLLDPLCRLDLRGGELHGDAADHRVGAASEALRSAVISPPAEQKADGCSSKLESAFQLFRPLFQIATSAIALALFVIHASLFGRSNFG